MRFVGRPSDFTLTCLIGALKLDSISKASATKPGSRASDANKRIIRRSLEGATATDMTVIAQQAALEYERKLSERDSDEGSEEE